MNSSQRVAPCIGTVADNVEPAPIKGLKRRMGYSTCPAAPPSRKGRRPTKTSRPFQQIGLRMATLFEVPPAQFRSLAPARLSAVLEPKAAQDKKCTSRIGQECACLWAQRPLVLCPGNDMERRAACFVMRTLAKAWARHKNSYHVLLRGFIELVRARAGRMVCCSNETP